MCNASIVKAVGSRHIVGLSVVLVLLSVAILGMLIRILWPFTADDSFITFRYAANLASGHGPTFNPGMARAEGYTSFLWMLLMAVPHLAGVDVVLFSKILGVVCTLSALLVVFALVRVLCLPLEGAPRHLAASVSFLLLATFYPTAIHAVSGMETALAMFLLVSYVCLTVLCLRGRRAVAWAAAATGLLLGLTRPEANLVVAAVFVYHLLVAGQKRKSLLVAYGLFYVLPGALYFAWRWSFYGLPLPLSFYVKVLARQGPMPGLVDALVYVAYVMGAVGFVVVLGFMRPNRMVFVPALATVVLLVFFLFPRSIMNYAWRFLYPTAPLVFALAGYGMGLLMYLLSPVIAKKPYVLLLLVAASVVMAGSFVRGTRSTVRDTLDYAIGLREGHVQLGKRLGRFATETGRRPTLAIGDTGAVPYYSGWRVVDTVGLNDPHVARHGLDPAHVFSQDPELVILVSNSSKVFIPDLYPQEEALYSKCLAQGMELLGTVVFQRSCYYLWLMGRPDSDVARFLARESSGTLQISATGTARFEPPGNLRPRAEAGEG
ncbi:MAG: hypothetical protein JXQ75_14105 [Phycisphaerae bacterium]|nr:hypothetical protein [Phycisphaerae bacterium]